MKKIDDEFARPNYVPDIDPKGRLVGMEDGRSISMALLLYKPHGAKRYPRTHTNMKIAYGSSRPGKTRQDKARGVWSTRVSRHGVRETIMPTKGKR